MGGSFVILFSRSVADDGGPASEFYLLLENGDYFLLEDGSKLILEGAYLADTKGSALTQETTPDPDDDFVIGVRDVGGTPTTVRIPSKSQVPKATTAEMNALTAADGDQVYNTDEFEMFFYSSDAADWLSATTGLPEA